MNSKKTTYSDKLKDPRWQKKRLEVLQRDAWTCHSCGDKESTLHVHHRIYTGSDPWDIPSECLITLCESCHESETENIGSVLADLNKEIKKKFLSSDIIDLTSAFYKLQPYHSSEVFSTVIEYWFKTPELVKEMYDRYFDYLSKKRTEPSPFDEEPF